jgi:AraC-like DNA-binding protein
MNYREIRPAPAAARYVKCYWLLEDDAPSREPQRIIPDGRSELIFNFAKPFESSVDTTWQAQPQCFFVGQITGPLLLRQSSPARVLGIRFHPHGAGQFLGVPMHELANTVTSLQDLPARRFSRFQRVHDCGSPQAALANLDAAFSHAAESRYTDFGPVPAAVGQLELSAGQLSVRAVAEAAGLSLRQFERRFRAAVGISPKLFSRMQRFQRVFHSSEQSQSDWVDTAVQCGYFDQAHLIRDFHEFAGKAPTSLLAGEVDLARCFAYSNAMSHFSNTHAARAV